MAWTRVGQCGWELNDTAEAAYLSGGASMGTISSTKARTGTYSYRQGTSFTQSPGFGFAAATQIRMGGWLNHNGISSGNIILARLGTTTTACLVFWEQTTNDLVLYIGASRDTIAAADAGITTTDQWYHLAFVVNVNSSTGWASFYVDGTQVLNATSQNTGTSYTACYFGDNRNTRYVNYAYWDDLCVDTGTGNSDAAMPLSRFAWVIADGNGTNSGWTGSDADSTDNYLLVDDTTPDDDTTYVVATSAALKDTYQCSAVSLPANASITAAIPTALTKRTSTTEQIKMLAYDGAATTTGSAQNPAADYAPIWERMTTQPDSSSWNETDFNAMEFGYESDGTY